MYNDADHLQLKFYNGKLLTPEEILLKKYYDLKIAEKKNADDALRKQQENSFKRMQDIGNRLSTVVERASLPAIPTQTSDHAGKAKEATKTDDSVAQAKAQIEDAIEPSVWQNVSYAAAHKKQFGDGDSSDEDESKDKDSATGDISDRKKRKSGLRLGSSSQGWEMNILCITYITYSAITSFGSVLGSPRLPRRWSTTC